jgi:hypothetical protein
LADAKASAFATDRVVLAILSSAALSASTELLLAFVVQIQCERRSVFVVAILVDAEITKKLATIIFVITFMVDSLFLSNLKNQSKKVHVLSKVILNKLSKEFL